MYKQKIFTSLGLTLSLAIAVGGWVLTGALIDKKTDALLSASGVVLINVLDPSDAASEQSTAENGSSDGLPEQNRDNASNGLPEQNGNEPPSGLPQQTGDNASNTLSEQSGDEPSSGSSARTEDNHPNGLPKLTEQEMVAVIQNWEIPAREILHEPTAEQIGMQDIITIGETAMAALAEYGIIPPEKLLFYKAETSAYLFQNIPHGYLTAPYFAPIYSYWYVVFRGEGVNAYLTINAVTGQVLIYNITFQSKMPIPSDNDYGYIQNALDYFMADLGINGYNGISIGVDSALSFTAANRVITAHREFAAGEAYAVLTASNGTLAIRNNETPVNEYDEKFFTQIRMYLSTQRP